MLIVEQLRRRREELRRTLQGLTDLTGLSRPYLSAILSKNSTKDVRASTLEAVAAGLDAQWVLVPRHLAPEVQRLLSGKSIAPDDVPSAMERMLGSGR